jgi:hypothetical protein
VLNGGNDMRELTDMAKLKKLVTKWLRQAHPTVVAEVEAAYEGIVPSFEDLRAQQDVFHLITAQHYDSKNRQAKLTGAVADRAVRSVVALVDVMVSDSAALEAFLLAQGIRKSNVPAPKSTGF